MQNRFFKLLTAFPAILLLAACQTSPEVNLDGSANGKEIQLARSQTLVLTLDSNITTGYSWEIASIDQKFLRAIGDAEYATSASNQPGLVGQGGSQIFRLQPLQSGRTTLTLEYRRPWEKDASPAQTFTITVIIE